MTIADVLLDIVILLGVIAILGNHIYEQAKKRDTILGTKV